MIPYKLGASGSYINYIIAFTKNGLDKSRQVPTILSMNVTKYSYRYACITALESWLEPSEVLNIFQLCLSFLTCT